ncbi:MAG: tetratricopeptide repeat protein [Alphaproteobacteria bacterium]
MHTKRHPRPLWFRFVAVYFLLSFSLLGCSADSEPKVYPFTQPLETSSHLTNTRAYLTAAVAEQRGAHTMAGQQYLKALTEVPDNLILRQKSYGYALASGDMDTAIRLAKTFTPTTAPDGVTWLLLSLDSMRSRDFKAAKAHLERAREQTPKLLHFQTLETIIDLAAGNTTALEKLEKFNTHNSLESRKQYMLGRLKAHMGDAAGALAAYETAQKIEPSSLFIALDLGEALERKGEIKAAYAVYDAFMAANPEGELLQHVFDRHKQEKPLTPYKKTTLEQEAAAVMFDFGLLMWAQRLDIAAKQMVNMAEWLDNSSERAAFVRFYSGMLEEAAGRTAEASRIYMSLPEQGPAWLSGQMRVVRTLVDTQEYAAAISLLQQLQTLYPAKTSLLQTLAQVYYDNDDFPNATKTYTTLFAALEEEKKANPTANFAAEEVQLLFARGASFERMNKFDKASADLEKALALNPDNPTILNYLGYMWLDTDTNIDKAFAYVAKAALLNPGDGAVLDSLGWGYYKKGDYAKALLYLEKAVTLIPNDPSVLEHLGDTHKKLGDPEKAQQYWQKAWDNNPTGKRERNRLADKLGK